MKVVNASSSLWFILDYSWLVIAFFYLLSYYRSVRSSSWMIECLLMVYFLLIIAFLVFIIVTLGENRLLPYLFLPDLCLTDLAVSISYRLSDVLSSPGNRISSFVLLEFQSVKSLPGTLNIENCYPVKIGKET